MMKRARDSMSSSKFAHAHLRQGNILLIPCSFKWGGEIQAKDGVFLTVEPIHGRVQMEENNEKMYGAGRSCVKKDGFTIKNDNKSMNGNPLDDTAEMAPHICIH